MAFLAFSLLLTMAAATFWGILSVFSREKAETVTASNPTVTVILDPGHGGEDGGAVGANKVYEKDLNLDIAKKVKALLKEKGITVKCTREEDILLYDRNADYKGRKKLLDLAARLNISRETENSVFVSIHMNAFPQTQYSGLQVYYSTNDSRSEQLALLIQNATRKTLQPNNTRLIKAATSSIYLMHRITTPAVLVECGFLSNDEECQKLSDEEYRAKLAEVLAEAIETFVDQQQNPQM